MENNSSEDLHSAETETSDTTRWRETPILLIKGFFMGSADIVPGVSGGTLALILGIYSRLLHAIKSFNKKVVKSLATFDIGSALRTFHWRFLLILVTGIITAFLFFTKVVPLQVYMFTDPEIVYGLFFGLIAGSIYFLFRTVESLRLYHFLFVLLGTGIGFWVVNLVPTNTPETPWFVFISGSIAICAMILPGISGSYILLILRKYDYILTQIGALGTSDTLQSLIILAPFLAGAVFGLMVFSRILSWLLDHYHAATLVALIGFLIGSLYVIWPYQDRDFRTIVRESRWLPVTNENVVQLKENPPDTDRPAYHRLGKIKEREGQPNQIQYQRVKKKLISSTPYIPYISEKSPEDYPAENVWKGVGGIVAGFFLVMLLERIR